MKARAVYLGLVFLLCMSCTSTFAGIYTFDIFTDNGRWGTSGIHGNDPRLVGGITVDVYNGINPVSGLPSAKFRFQNDIDPTIIRRSREIGPSITDIYFDNGSLFGISTIHNMPDEGSGYTLFGQPATPSEIPGSSILDPDFETSTNNAGGELEMFSVDSDPPPYHNGVQIGEWIIIEFDLYGGSTIDDVIAELYSGELRIAIHLQGFSDGSSESAVNIPEPATLLLLGLGGLVLRRRKA